MEVYLIRHTRVAVETAICYGQTDVLSADTFEQEAVSLRQRLPYVWEAVYSSPLGRCTRLLPYFPCALLTQDERLMEMHFGEWELQPWNAIEPAILKHWSSDFVNHRVPAGETYGELYERVVASWEEIVAKGHQGNVAIIAHGGVIRALLAHLLSIPLLKSFHLDISYGSVSCVQVQAQFSKVLYINRI
ncbi:MAG: alpha-ribazole phosphatase [Bacteroidota bacterium]